MLTTAAARSAERVYRRYCRRRISGRSLKVVSTVWITGLLLRSDVHTLFDRGYLAVDPRYRLLVSPRLRVDFRNGGQFYAKAGQVIELPEPRADRPNGDFLEWHVDEVFKAS
jgi:predicted restriction endonuclease